MQKYFTTIVLILTASFVIFGILVISRILPDKNIKLTPHSIETSTLELGGDFALTDIDDNKVDTSGMRDKFLLIYFGFTFCPDVCPLELQKISAVLDMLESQSELVKPMFITLDPERDQVHSLHSYLEHFDKRILGLTGSKEEIEDVASLFKVYHSKTGDDRYYMINHSSLIYLVDKEGKVIKIFTPSDTAEDITLHIKHALTLK